MVARRQTSSWYAKCFVLRAGLFTLLSCFTSLMCLSSLISGCSRSKEDASSSVGTFGVSLQALGVSGQRYQLRDASFRITGSVQRTIDSEDHLAENFISLELPAGSYVVELGGDWRMEEVIDGEPVAVRAQLVSENPQALEIEDQVRTDLRFQFQVGDDVITFGSGVLDLGIEVEDVGDSCERDCPTLEDFEDFIDDNELVVSTDAQGFLISSVRPETGAVEIVNRSSEAQSGELTLWTKQGRVSEFLTLGAFEGVQVVAPLDPASDFVLAAFAGSAFQYLEYGSSFPSLPLRSLMWRGPAIETPVGGERIVPQNAGARTAPNRADAYGLFAPSGGAGVSGTILDMDQVQLADVSILAVCDSGRAWEEDTSAVQSAEDGTFLRDLPDIDASVCWLQFRKDGYVPRTMAVVTRGEVGIDLGVVKLQAYSTVPGVRTSDTRVDFEEGVWLEADKADLDALPTLFFTRLPQEVASVVSPTPTLFEEGWAVHAADATQSLGFPTTPALLHVDTDAPLVTLEDDEEFVVLSAATLADFSPPSAQVEENGLLVVYPSYVAALVDHFSTLVLMATEKGRIVAQDSDGGTDDRPVGNCPCQLNNGEGRCEYPDLVFEASSEKGLEGTDQAKASLGTALGVTPGEGGGGSASLEAALEVLLSRTTSGRHAIKQTITCVANAGAPLLCHDIQLTATLQMRNTRLTFSRLVGGGFFDGPERWVEGARVNLTYPIGCLGTREEFIENAAQCGCSKTPTGLDGDPVFGSLDSFLIHFPNGERLWSEPECEGDGFVVTKRELPVAAEDAPNCDALFPSISRLCQPALNEMAATGEQSCQQICESKGCGRAVFDTTPPPDLAKALSCFPVGENIIVGYDTRCAVAASCKCEHICRGVPASECPACCEVNSSSFVENEACLREVCGQ